MELRFNINIRPDALLPQSDSSSDYKNNSRTNSGDALGGRSFEEFAEQMAMAFVAELLKGNPLLQQLLGDGNERGEESIGGGGGGGGAGQGLGQDFGSRFKEALFSYLDQLLGGSKAGKDVQGRGDPGNEKTQESNLPNSASQFLRGGGTSLLNNSIAPTQDGGGQVQNREVLAPITNLMDKHPQVFGKPNQKSELSTSLASDKPNATPTANTKTPVEQFTKPVSLSQVTNSDTSEPSPSKSAPPKITSTHSEGNYVFTKLAEGGAGGSSGVEFPKASASPTVVNEPIVVKKGEEFDGKGRTFTAGSKLGDGGQSENQRPLFILEDGASLKNVVIGDNGADGVHLYGDAKVDNVHWTDVGEDALTVKPNKEGKKANVEITNSSAQGANDKIFQLNADANITIDNFKAKDFGTFLRTNGGQQGDWNINLKNITAEDGKYKFVNSDAEGVKLSADNIRLQSVAEHIRLSKSSTLDLG